MRGVSQGNCPAMPIFGSWLPCLQYWSDNNVASTCNCISSPNGNINRSSLKYYHFSLTESLLALSIKLILDPPITCSKHTDCTMYTTQVFKHKFWSKLLIVQNWFRKLHNLSYYSQKKNLFTHYCPNISLNLFILLLLNWDITESFHWDNFSGWRIAGGFAGDLLTINLWWWDCGQWSACHWAVTVCIV